MFEQAYSESFSFKEIKKENTVVMTSRFWTGLLYWCGALSSVQLSHADVVMTGTRVIFPAETQQKTLQFSNNSNLSFLVQVWLDKGNMDSTPETADAPFNVNPQVFRVNSHTGQMARLTYIGDDKLPKDRESIFYLNFKQIPAMDKKMIDENRLVLLVKNRLKVFYRPNTIVGKVQDLPQELNFNISHDQQGSWLEIQNPTGYYANLTRATVKIGAKEIKTKSISMIAPKSSEKWLLEQNISATDQAKVTVRLVNDYGAYVHYDIKAQK